MAATDDKELFVIRKDISGGMNNRLHGSEIGDQQVTNLVNVDLRTPGIADKRAGTNLIEDLGDTGGSGSIGFNPAGGTNQVVVTHGHKLETYPGTGTFTERYTSLASVANVSLIKIGESGEGDVLAIQDGVNGALRMNQSYSFQNLGTTSGTGSDSPPLSLVNLWWRNRWWVMKDNLLYWSSAFSADYSTAFDTNNDNFNIPIGEERALVGIRDEGILCFGEDAVWGVNPATTPVATDKPELILEIGCIANNSVVTVGNDVLYLAADGVRALFRSQQDKLQLGQTFPLSYPLKEEFESLNFNAIEKATAVFFDNVYLIAVPVDSSSTNNEVWAYFPATGAWSVFIGWNVAAWSTVRINGEEKLYYIDSTDGDVYQAFTGTTDAGTVIQYTEEGRKEDLGQPLLKKNGGEAFVKLISTGDVDVTVSMEFDDGGYNELGSINALGNFVTFPVTFPVVFGDANIIAKKFHLDTYDSWYQARIKIENNISGEDSDVKVLERSIVTYLDEYQSEED